LTFIDKGNPGRFNSEVKPDPALDMSSANTARRSFAEIYKNEQTKILKAQQSLVQDAIAFVQILKWPSKDTTAQKIKFA